MPESDPRPQADWRTWLALGLILAALIGALVAWGRPVYEFVADRDQVQAWMESLSPWGPAAVVALEFVQATLGPVPGTAIEAASGYLFGPWLGALYAMIGVAGGSLVTFLVVRHFGRPLFLRLARPETVDRLDELVNRGGELLFFLIWLFPLLPDDLVCLAAGLTPMPTRRFLLLMVVGRFPGLLASTWLGAHAAEVGPIWWIAAIVALILAALAFWRWGEQAQAAMLRFLEDLANRWERTRI